MKSPFALLVATGALVPLAASAAQAPAEQTELTTITVTASKLRVLEQETPTSSRLGLTARETPATIDTIDSDEMLGRGYPTIEFATASMPGVITGGSPGDLADFSMRGFSGQQIYLLHNGLAIGPSNMVNRPMNTFNLARVEILKGPSSVLYGQGAIGGVVNIVNKRPSYSDVPLEIAASIGRFGATAIGVGGGTHWGDTVAVRADVSRTASDGYVKNASSDSLSIFRGHQLEAVGQRGMALPAGLPRRPSFRLLRNAPGDKRLRDAAPEWRPDVGCRTDPGQAAALHQLQRRRQSH